MRVLSSIEVEILSNSWQRSYWTLAATFPEGVTRRIAGTTITLNGERYEGEIVSTSGLRASLGTSVDRIDVTVQNVDWSWTKLAREPRTLLTRVTVGRAIARAREGPWAHIIMLNGIIVSIPSNEQYATLQCISDLYAAPAIGAIRQIARPCQWKYKDPRTCGYTGPEPTCNKIFESADGCAGRNNQHRYGGFLYDTGKDSLYLPAPDPNSNPYPGGGGIGGDGDIYHKFENPYLLGY